MKKIYVLLFVSLFSSVLTACAAKKLEGNINVYTRDAVSGTREAFQSIVGFESNDLVITAIESAGNGDQASKTGNDKNGISYVSLSTNFEANNIKALKYEGVEATEENVINGTYTLSRPFSYTTRAENDFSSDDVKQMTAAFIAYLGTKDAMAVLKSKLVIVDDSNAPTWNSIKAQHPIVNNSTDITVRMGGSTSVKASVEAVAEAFKALAPAFEFTTNQTGSGDGYKRTLGSNKDNSPVEIGFASRSFSVNEDVSTAFKKGVYGIDAIAVAVEKNNPLEDITKENLRKIYTGEMTKWEELIK